MLAAADFLKYNTCTVPEQETQTKTHRFNRINNGMRSQMNNHSSELWILYAVNGEKINSVWWCVQGVAMFMCPPEFARCTDVVISSFRQRRGELFQKRTAILAETSISCCSGKATTLAQLVLH
jgi:hypothetical protein